MDVSPKELLDNDIREAWRGYNREDVEALLEKAAATIEGLGEKVKQLSDRVRAAETDMSHGKETEDMLHRTLLLAQRTADEAVTEAQTRARQLLEDAENKSRALVTEAEANARRVSDDERTRLENEILDLASRREALTSDVDALQQYESEYRGRLQRALESDLEILKQQQAGPSVPRPQLSTVEIPVLAEGFARHAPVVEEPVFEEPVVEEPVVEEPAADEPAVEEPAVEEPAVEEPAVEEPAAENPEVDNEAEPEPAAASGGDEPSGDTSVDLTGAGDADKLEAYVPAANTAEPANADAGNGVAAAETPGVEAVEGKMLDDDAFFASLREAVRDDAPLGPRDDEAAEPGFFDQDEADATNRKLFKRRR